MLEFTTTHWLIGLAAGFLVGFTKTGMPGLGMLIVALLAMVFPAKLSVGTLLPLLLIGDVFAIAKYRRHAQWGTLLRLLPFVLTGMVPARLFLAAVPEQPFKLSLGILVLGMILLDRLRRHFRWENVPKSILFVATMGILAGFATTIGNVAGPIMSVYLLSMGLDKHKFMGTGAWYYLVVNALKVPIFVNLGMITADTLRFDLIAAPLVALGALAGILALPRIPQKAFTGVVLSLAALAAVSLILNAIG